MAYASITQRPATSSEISELCAFLEHRCGSLAAAFRELDSQSAGKIRIDTFVHGVYSLGYKRNTMSVFYALDSAHQKYITSSTFVQGLRRPQVATSVLHRDDDVRSATDTTRSSASLDSGWKDTEPFASMLRRVCLLEERLASAEDIRDQITEERMDRVLAQERMQEAIESGANREIVALQIDAKDSQQRCAQLEQGLNDASTQAAARCDKLEGLICHSLAEIRDELSARFEVEHCQNVERMGSLFDRFRADLETEHVGVVQKLASLELLSSGCAATCEALRQSLSEEVKRNAKAAAQAEADMQDMERKFTERVKSLEAPPACAVVPGALCTPSTGSAPCGRLQKQLVAVTDELATTERLVHSHLGAITNAVASDGIDGTSQSSEGFCQQVVALANRVTECEGKLLWQGESMHQGEIERRLHQEQVAACGQELAVLTSQFQELRKAAQSGSVDPKEHAALQAKVAEWDKALPQVQAAFDAANTVGTCDELQRQLTVFGARLAAAEQQIVACSKRGPESEHVAASDQKLAVLQEKVDAWDTALLEGKLGGHRDEFSHQTAVLHESITAIAQTVSRLQLEFASFRDVARQARAPKEPIGDGSSAGSVSVATRDESTELQALRVQAQLHAAYLEQVKQTIATDRARAEARHQAFHDKINVFISNNANGRQEPTGRPSFPRGGAPSVTKHEASQAPNAAKARLGLQSASPRGPPSSSPVTRDTSSTSTNDGLQALSRLVACAGKAPVSPDTPQLEGPPTSSRASTISKPHLPMSGVPGGEETGEAQQATSTIRTLIEENSRLKDMNFDLLRREVETLRTMARTSPSDVQPAAQALSSPNRLLRSNVPTSPSLASALCGSSRGISPVRRTELSSPQVSTPASTLTPLLGGRLSSTTAQVVPLQGQQRGASALSGAQPLSSSENAQSPSGLASRQNAHGGPQPTNSAENAQKPSSLLSPVNVPMPRSTLVASSSPTSRTSRTSSSRACGGLTGCQGLRNPYSVRASPPQSPAGSLISPGGRAVQPHAAPVSSTPQCRA